MDFIDDDAPLVLPASCLAIAVLSPAAGPSTAADELDDVLLALGPTDRAMVLGPASLLVASAGQAARRRLLTDAAATGATLRYAAPLPKGMLTRSARRRLALWVLAGRDSVATSAMTVTADHGDASLSEGVTQAIAADLAVVMSGDTAAIRDHAFRSGGPLDAGAVHAAADITAPRTAASEQRLGADLLAEALHADEELLAAVPEAQALLVRSATTVDREVLEAGGLQVGFQGRVMRVHGGAHPAGGERHGGTQ